jgi:hypothetical protein
MKTQYEYTIITNQKITKKGNNTITTILNELNKILK